LSEARTRARPSLMMAPRPGVLYESLAGPLTLRLGRPATG
jgi:hypothetical protein